MKEEVLTNPEGKCIYVRLRPVPPHIYNPRCSTIGDTAFRNVTFLRFVTIRDLILVRWTAFRLPHLVDGEPGIPLASGRWRSLPRLLHLLRLFNSWFARFILRLPVYSVVHTELRCYLTAGRNGIRYRWFCYLFYVCYVSTHTPPVRCSVTPSRRHYRCEPAAEFGIRYDAYFSLRFARYLTIRTTTYPAFIVTVLRWFTFCRYPPHYTLPLWVWYVYSPGCTPTLTTVRTASFTRRADTFTLLHWVRDSGHHVWLRLGFTLLQTPAIPHLPAFDVGTR